MGSLHKMTVTVLDPKTWKPETEKTYDVMYLEMNTARIFHTFVKGLETPKEAKEFLWNLLSQKYLNRFMYPRNAKLKKS